MDASPVKLRPARRARSPELTHSPVSLHPGQSGPDAYRTAHIRWQQDLIRERARAEAMSPPPVRRPYRFRPKPSDSPWDSAGFLLPEFRVGIAPKPPSSDTRPRCLIDANSQMIIDQNPHKPLEQRSLERRPIEDQMEHRYISLDDFQDFLTRQQSCVESRRRVKPRPRVRSSMNRMSRHIIRHAARRDAEEEEEEDEEEEERKRHKAVAPVKPQKGLQLDELARGRVRAIKLLAIKMEVEAQQDAKCTFIPKFVSSEAWRRRAKAHEDEIRAGARKKERMEASRAESEARREQACAARVPRTSTPKRTRELAVWMRKLRLEPRRPRKKSLGPASPAGRTPDR